MSGLTLPVAVARQRDLESSFGVAPGDRPGKVNPDMNPNLFPNPKG